LRTIWHAGSSNSSIQEAAKAPAQRGRGLGCTSNGTGSTIALVLFQYHA
jgi:hypothetical protein